MPTFLKVGISIPNKKAPIETALNKLKEAHKAQDLAAIDAATAEMNTAWTAASEEIYKAQDLAAIDAATAEMNTAWTAASEEIYKAQQTGADGQPNGNGHAAEGAQQQSAGTGDHVEDAQFEEVK